MEIEQAQGCMNFRDVGAAINQLAKEDLLPTGRLFRGGALDTIDSAAGIGNPATIINLRRVYDHDFFNADYFYFPITNDHRCYDVTKSEVRRWLTGIVSVFEARNLRNPILLHCKSGKDRTGTVTAALLRILGLPDALIVAEYLLSKGEIQEAWIRQTLDTLGDPEIYFAALDLAQVRRSILL